MKLDKTKITPHQAEEWIKTVPHYQRKVDERQVKKLEIAIRRGEWRENGATIVFNRKGELIDGQHRLMAIIRSGISVYSLVVTNVSEGEETFNTIGDEKARRLTDFLHTTNVNNVGSVVRYAWAIQNKDWPQLHITAPIPDMLKIAKEHGEYISALIAPVAQAGRIIGGVSYCAFLVFYHTKIYEIDHPERLAQFFARVGDGIGLVNNDPAYQLRKRFLELRGTISIPRRAAWALTLKALNAHLDNHRIEKLSFSPDREPFPPLRGYDAPVPMHKKTAGTAGSVRKERKNYKQAQKET